MLLQPLPTTVGQASMHRLVSLHPQRTTPGRQTRTITCANPKRSSNKGGGGNNRRGKKKSGGGGSKQPSKTSKRNEPPPNPSLAPPLAVHISQHLTGLERITMPFWSTFCGLSNGEWRGQMAAFNPMTGEPEPVALDAKNQPLVTLQTVTMERRQADDNGTDRIVRQIWRAAAEQALAVSSGLDTHAGGQTRGNAANTMGTDDGGDTDSNSKGTDGNTNTAAEPDDVEEIYQDDGGLVYFDGGTYSLGPSVIGTDVHMQAAALEGTAAVPLPSGAVSRADVGRVMTGEDALAESILAAAAAGGGGAQEGEEGEEEMYGEEGEGEEGEEEEGEEGEEEEGEEGEDGEGIVLMTETGEQGVVLTDEEEQQLLLELENLAFTDDDDDEEEEEEEDDGEEGEYEEGEYEDEDEEVFVSAEEERYELDLPPPGVDDVLEKEFAAVVEQRMTGGYTDASMPFDDDYGEGEMMVAGENASMFRQTSVIEHCMMVNGEERLRVKLTLSIAGGQDGTELDVEVLRVALLLETWEGEGPDGWTNASIFNQQPTQQPLVGKQRLSAAILDGKWRAFDVWASPVWEQDPNTLQERQVWEYSSQETEQRWRVGGTTGAGVTEEGGVLWLPGNVAVELVMVPNPKDNGAIAARKGLRISSYYVSAKEQVHVLSREYAPDGELVEVRSRTAVKGNGWVGGAM